jgi:hypothetical protein
MGEILAQVGKQFFFCNSVAYLLKAMILLPFGNKSFRQTISFIFASLYNK